MKDHNGFRKSRPVIILTPDEEIAADTPLAEIAITTTFPDPTPNNCIELRWNPDARRVSTGLARRSAAVVDWLETVYPDEITDIIGAVPPRTMKLIRRRLLDL